MPLEGNLSSAREQEGGVGTPIHRARELACAALSRINCPPDPMGSEFSIRKAGSACSQRGKPHRGLRTRAGRRAGGICYCSEQVAHVLTQKQDLFLKNTVFRRGLGLREGVPWLLGFCVVFWGSRGVVLGEETETGRGVPPKAAGPAAWAPAGPPGSRVLPWTLGVPAGTPTLASEIKPRPQVPRPRSPVP